MNDSTFTAKMNIENHRPLWYRFAAARNPRELERSMLRVKNQFPDQKQIDFSEVDWSEIYSSLNESVELKENIQQFDDVRIKSKNTTGVVVDIKGNTAQVKTSSGDETVSVKDLEIIITDSFEYTNEYVLFELDNRGNEKHVKTFEKSRPGLTNAYKTANSIKDWAIYYYDNTGKRELIDSSNKDLLKSKPAGLREETVYIDYLNKEKNFKKDRKIFKGRDAFKKAKEWGQKNIGNFNQDMIMYENNNTIKDLLEKISNKKYSEAKNILFDILEQKKKNCIEKKLSKDSIDIKESIKSNDKRVVDSFYKKQSNDSGSILSTDGKKLEKIGMGGQIIAEWKGNKILIVAEMDSRSTQSIVRYMKKSIPTNIFA